MARPQDGPGEPRRLPAEVSLDLEAPRTASPRRRERADAAANRRKVLDAAERLVAEHGVGGLSMEGLAREAGVGVGTLYRRFGDRAGLLNALLDARELDLQEAFLHGPPPLGPGAPAGDRIEAFLAACVDHLERHTDLSLASEGADPFMRVHAASYRTRRLHLVTLLREVAPDADAEYLAAALLEPLGAHNYVHQRHELGMSVDRITTGIATVARGVVSVAAASSAR